MSAGDALGPQFLDLYHRTTPEAAEEILRQGRMTSKENPARAYFSTSPTGQGEGYGEAVVHVRVPKEHAELDDEFPDGEQHYAVPLHRLTRKNFVLGEDK